MNGANHEIAARVSSLSSLVTWESLDAGTNCLDIYTVLDLGGYVTRHAGNPNFHLAYEGLLDHH
jgi:hypothetical protein